MLPRLQAMRVRLFNKAVSKGQLQTAAQILDSLGKVIGESVETVNIQAPQLSIKVEQQQYKRISNEDIGYILMVPGRETGKIFSETLPPEYALSGLEEPRTAL